MAVYGRNIYPDQDVYIGVSGDSSLGRLLGVQGFDGDWTLPLNNMLAGGYGPIGESVDGAIEGSVSVSRLITRTSDPITGLLAHSISGFLSYGSNKDKSFGFSQAYVNSFSSTCAVGDVATADFGLTVYGGISNQGAPKSDTVKDVAVARAGNISLNVAGYQTNAIQSYSFSFDIERTPLQTLGNNYRPTEFVLSYPIEVNVEFDLVVNDYETSGIYDLICFPHKEDLTIALNDCNGSGIRTFFIEQARFAGYNTTSSVGDNMTVSISYIKNLKNSGDLPGLFQH